VGLLFSYSALFALPRLQVAFAKMAHKEIEGCTFPQRKKLICSGHIEKAAVVTGFVGEIPFTQRGTATNDPTRVTWPNVIEKNAKAYRGSLLTD